MTRFLPLLLIPLLAAGTSLHAAETPPDTEALNSGALRQSGFDAGVDKVVVPLEWNPLGLSVRVEINGKPMKLTVDTGCSHTILSPRAAERAGVGTNAGAKGLSASGDLFDATLGMTSVIRIGKAWTRSEPVVVVKLPGKLNDHMDGFLGIATLRDWDVRLDVPGRTMTLFPAGKADGPEGETSVPLILIPHDDSEGNNPTKLRPGTFLTRASINGKAIPLLVDTGFDASLDLPAALAEKAVPGICAREQKSVETLTASGLGQSRTGHFPTVRFGPDTFASLAGIISTRPAGSRGNDRGKLGLEVLRHYVMTFRFEEGRLGLKPVGTPWKPDPGSTRGFTFTPDFKIFGIRRGGPAGKAGLKKGDRVLAINGHDPRSMTMEAISAFDELPPGTTLRIRYSRNGGEPKEVAVILEKE